MSNWKTFQCFELREQEEIVLYTSRKNWEWYSWTRCALDVFMRKLKICHSLGEILLKNVVTLPLQFTQELASGIVWPKYLLLFSSKHFLPSIYYHVHTHKMCVLKSLGNRLDHKSWIYVSFWSVSKLLFLKISVVSKPSARQLNDSKCHVVLNKHLVINVSWPLHSGGFFLFVSVYLRSSVFLCIVRFLLSRGG